MALTTATTGSAILASDLNQLVYTLQKATGMTETGSYYLGFNSYVNNALGSLYMPSLSRNSTPASVSIDTSLQSPSNCSSPGASNLNANGFQITATGTAITANAHCAGNFVITY